MCTSIFVEDLVTNDAHEREKLVDLLQIEIQFVVEFNTRVRGVVERDALHIFRSSFLLKENKNIIINLKIWVRVRFWLRVDIGYVEDEINLVAAELVELRIQRAETVGGDEDLRADVEQECTLETTTLFEW